MTSLPISTPAVENVDPAGISSFLAAVEAAPSIDPHSLLILRHGRQIAAGSWSPYSAGRPQLLYSLSKSFTATAAALAIADGLLGLDDPVVDHFPEYPSHARSRGLLVRHLAAMATGHLTDTWQQVRGAVDPVAAFLQLPPDRAPGTVFAYNQSATYTLAAIVQRRTGETLTDYLRPRLFDPLGVGRVGWLTDDHSRQLGYSGLHASTDAIARLGQLYLQRGRWNGTQLLTEAWVAEATRPQVANPDEPHPDWQQGYGFQFWMSRHGYRGDGAYGQFCLVLPEQNAVIAIPAETHEMHLLLGLVWQHLLPAFASESDQPGADEALTAQLAGLSLPVAARSTAPADWSGQAFRPAGPNGQPSLTAIEVTPDGDGWQIALIDSGAELTCALGVGSWAQSTGEFPLAVNGGWADEESLVLDVLFLETPHRLTLTCRRRTGTFDLAWHTAPMHGMPLHRLRCP